MTQLNEAREIVDEYGVEEGAEFNFHRHTGEIAAEITVTEVKSSGSGARRLRYEMSTDEKTVEQTTSIVKAAEHLDSEHWSEIEQ